MSFRRCEQWRFVTSSIIQTILSVSELHRFNLARLADYHRRSGITPCPEDISIQLFYCLHYSTVGKECKYFLQERFDSSAPGAYNGGHHRKEAPPCPSAKTPAASPATGNTSCPGAATRTTPAAASCSSSSSTPWTPSTPPASATSSAAWPTAATCIFRRCALSAPAAPGGHDRGGHPLRRPGRPLAAGAARTLRLRPAPVRLSDARAGGLHPRVHDAPQPLHGRCLAHPHRGI